MKGKKHGFVVKGASASAVKAGRKGRGRKRAGRKHTAKK